MKKEETKFKERVIKNLKKRLPDIWWLKTDEQSIRGVPDLLICYYGCFVAVELKVYTEETEMQKVNGRWIENAGGIYLKIDLDNEDVLYDYLDSIGRNVYLP